MNWTTFTPNAYKTLSEIYLPSKRKSIDTQLHCAMGLVTEYSELANGWYSSVVDDINMAEEIGDMYWYLGILCNELKLDMEEMDEAKYEKKTPGTFVYRIGIISGMILDFYKKYCYYDKELDMDKLKDCLKDMFQSISNFCKERKYDMGEIRNKNIAKLKERYPDKFDKEKAVKRNLKKERNILES